MKKSTIMTGFLSSAALVGLATVALASVAFASTPTFDPSNFLANDSTQTPFQQLEALYNRATPMQIGQFLTPQSPDLKNWQCSSNVASDTQLSKMSASNSALVLLTGTITTGQKFGGVGPLFPSVPEQDQTVLMIDFVANDGSDVPDAKTIGSNYELSNIQLITYPGVSQIGFTDASMPKSKYIDTFRWVDNMIVVHQIESYPDFFNNDWANVYYYCWEQKPAN